MADDVRKVATGAQSPSSPPAVAGTKPARVDSRAERARRAAYRSRFALLYVLLAIVAGGALGALVVLVSRGSPAPAAAWSSFQPTGTNDQKVAQIAANIGGKYHLPSGDQLVTITAGSPSVTGPDGTSFRVNAIAVRPDTSRGQADPSDISAVNAAGTVMYQLCGLGKSCSIPQGKATVARGTLLRREALELALYTFKYVNGTDSVLVAHAASRRTGRWRRRVFLEHSDLAPELKHPLSATLSAPLTPGIGEIDAAELRVDRAHHAAAPVHVQLRPGSGREPDHGAHARPRLLRVAPELGPAVERAKARLDRLDYYPTPVSIRRVRVVIAPWFFRMPFFRRFTRVCALADDPAPPPERLARPPDARALPHLAGTAAPLAHALHLRDDALREQPVRGGGAPSGGRDRDGRSLTRPPRRPTL